MGILQPGDRIIADPLAALLPGLTGTFEALDILQVDDIHRALQLHQSRVIQREQALSFFNALPFLEQRTAAANASFKTESLSLQSAPDNRAPQPTHLLDRHVARPLVGSGTPLPNGWSLYQSKEGWQLRGEGAAALVNGQAYRPGQILATGDAIVIDGSSAALLIEVMA
jgi:hypothetical protein